MPRTGNARRSRRSPPQPQPPGWVWMLFGLGLGLVVAMIVYVRGGAPVDDRGAPAIVAISPDPPPAPTSEAVTVSAAPEQRFEFYELLPQFEVVVPENESVARRAAPLRQVQEPGRYVLQAGSFTRAADADRRQASLALLGIESRVQRVSIDGDEFHRVRIGPLEDLDEVNDIRAQLQNARIDSVVMKAGK
jgi:cell division protein FtsN